MRYECLQGHGSSCGRDRLRTFVLDVQTAAFGRRLLESKSPAQGGESVSAAVHVRTVKAFPASSTLAKMVLAAPAGRESTVADSASYLVSKRADLTYKGIEHLVTSPDDDLPKLRKGSRTSPARCARASIRARCYSRTPPSGVRLRTLFTLRMTIPGWMNESRAANGVSSTPPLRLLPQPRRPYPG